MAHLAPLIEIVTQGVEASLGLMRLSVSRDISRGYKNTTLALPQTNMQPETWPFKEHMRR